MMRSETLESTAFGCHRRLLRALDDHRGGIVADTYLTQHFVIAWRVWLTDRLTVDWLSDDGYHRGQLAGHAMDNPD